MSKIGRWSVIGFVLCLGCFWAGLSFSEDCVSFNPITATVANPQGNSWKVVDGSHWVFDFGADKASADRSLQIIKQYGMNQSCFVGRPNPPFQYTLVSGKAPAATPLPNEDCIPFNPATTAVANVQGDWKIIDGKMAMYSFGNRQDLATEALGVIKARGFNQQCFVGRPNPHFQYLKVSAAPPQPPRRITSCQAKITINAQIPNEWLHSAVNAQAMAVNYNQVEVDITGSLIRDGNVECYYKSKNGDIPNLVYKYPCSSARKEATGYAHSYSCSP